MQELRLTTVEPGVCIYSTMYDAAEALEEAVKQQEAAAEAIEAGKTTEAFEPMQAAVRVWQAVSQAATQGTALVGIDAGEIEVPKPDGSSEKGSVLITRLQELLNELKRAIDEQDWSALGDTLAYDLKDEAQVWSAFLRRVGDLARNG